MKDIKKFYVITKENSHEYDITVTETDTGRTFDLYYSMSGEWSQQLNMTNEEDQLEK